MKTRHFSSTSTLIFAFCLAAISVPRAQAPAAAPPPPPSVKTGQTAPDFTANYFLTVDGKRQNKAVKLSDYKGQKNVVLAFFPAAFTGGCTKEMLAYQANSAKFEGAATKIIDQPVSFLLVGLESVGKGCCHRLLQQRALLEPSKLSCIASRIALV